MNISFNTPVAIEHDGKLYFNPADVAARLGYRHPEQAIARHCRDINTTIMPGTRLIPESDFYRIVFRSRKPAAKAFVRWVCHDVLPSIRRTGGYATPRFRDWLQTATPDALRDMVERMKADRDRRLAERNA